jgi:DNA-binding NarL/FixJ family response regulator
MRVLIVDDEPGAQRHLKALLDAWDQIREIREAANTCEAIHMLEKFQPQIIVMDARVANTNGLKAIRRVKEKYHSFPIIVLSLNPLVKVEALAAGADTFVSKNDPPAKLREALWVVVEERKRGSGKLRMQ